MDEYDDLGPPPPNNPQLQRSDAGIVISANDIEDERIMIENANRDSRNADNMQSDWNDIVSGRNIDNVRSDLESRRRHVGGKKSRRRRRRRGSKRSRKSRRSRRR